MIRYKDWNEKEKKQPMTKEKGLQNACKEHFTKNYKKVWLIESIMQINYGWLKTFVQYCMARKGKTALKKKERKKPSNLCPFTL